MATLLGGRWVVEGVEWDRMPWRGISQGTTHSSRSFFRFLTFFSSFLCILRARPGVATASADQELTVGAPECLPLPTRSHAAADRARPAAPTPTAASSDPLALSLTPNRGYPTGSLLQSGRAAQCPRHRPPRPKSRGPLRYVRQEVDRQRHLHARPPAGPWQMLHVPSCDWPCPRQIAQ